jgi:hypothetical protein
MLPLARLEGEPKSGAIFAYLFISVTLRQKIPLSWSRSGILTWLKHFFILLGQDLDPWQTDHFSISPDDNRYTMNKQVATQSGSNPR